MPEMVLHKALWNVSSQPSQVSLTWGLLFAAFVLDWIELDKKLGPVVLSAGRSISYTHWPTLEKWTCDGQQHEWGQHSAKDEC